MNKIFKKAITITLASAITVSAGIETGVGNFAPITAQAESLHVSNVTVTDFTSSTITVNWEGDSNANSYEISYKIYGINSQYIVAGHTSATTYTIDGLESGCLYSICVTPSNSAGDSGSPGYYSNAKTKISTIRGLKQDTWYHYTKNAGISWEKLDAADGYEYKWISPTGKVLKKGTTTMGSMSFDVKNNNIYQFSLRAYQQINGKKTYTPWKTIQVFEQPWVKSVAIKKTKKGKNYLSIAWYKQKGATGYDIYVSKKTEKNSFKKVKSVGKNKASISLSKFKGKKIQGTYYVYVVSKSKNANGTSKSGVTYVWNTGNNNLGRL